MKILFAYDFHPENLNFPCSGLQVLGYTFATELRIQGHKVEQVNMFDYESFKTAIINFNPDVIVPNGYWGDSTFFTLGKLTGHKVVPFAVTDGRIPTLVVEELNKLDGVVVLSQACRKVMERDGIEIPINVVYPGISFDIFKPTKFTGSNEEQKQLLESKKILSHWIHGGDRQLLEAMEYVVRDVPNAILFEKIQYSQTKEHLTWANKLIEEKGLQKNVRFLDVQVPHHLMGDIYNLTDVYASPGGIIGFEYPFVESMACMKTVVGMAHGTTPEIVKHNDNGMLVSPKRREKKIDVKAGFDVEEEYVYPDPKEVAEVLVKLLTYDNFRNNLALQGYRDVHQRFDIKNQAKELVKVLESL